MSQPTTTGMRTRVLPYLALLLCICVVRGGYVVHYGGTVPFWDEWDAGAARLFKPWVEGTLALPDLWRAHNEHRILPTRLLGLALFEAAGHWDNRLEARFNVLLFALVALLMLRYALAAPRRWQRATMVAMLLSLSLLPFSWENFLVGFQSQFYLLVLAALGAIALAASRPWQAPANAGMLALAALACLTSASGLLAPAACAGLYLLRLWLRPREHAGRGLLLAGALVAIAAAAYATTPQVPGHAPLRAQDLVGFLEAFGRVLGWPARAGGWTFVVFWAPGVAALAAILARRRADAADLFMLGCLAWAFLQAVAIAYGRGNGMVAVPSRYSEALLPGLVGNAWFALRLLAGSRPYAFPVRAAALAACAAFFMVYAWAQATRLQGDVHAMRDRHAHSLVQARNVACYLDTGAPGCLQVGHFEIPYPRADRLQQLLDDPTIRGLLVRCEIAPCADAGRETR